MIKTACSWIRARADALQCSEDTRITRSPPHGIQAATSSRREIRIQLLDYGTYDICDRVWPCSEVGWPQSGAFDSIRPVNFSPWWKPRTLYASLTSNRRARVRRNSISLERLPEYHLRPMVKVSSSALRTIPMDRCWSTIARQLSKGRHPSRIR